MGPRLKISPIVSFQQPEVGFFFFFLFLRSSEFSAQSRAPTLRRRTRLFRQKRAWKFQLHVIFYTQHAEMIMHLTQCLTGTFADWKNLSIQMPCLGSSREEETSTDGVSKSQTCQGFLYPQNDYPQSVKCLSSTTSWIMFCILGFFSLSFCVPKLIEAHKCSQLDSRGEKQE